MEDKDRFKAKYGSPAMHEKLVDHPDENLRGQVAWHGNEHIKRKLENDPASYVRTCAMHGAPKDMLDRGVKSNDVGVRMAVAQSPTSTDEHHLALMHDNDDVQFSLSSHTKNPEVLHHLSQAGDWNTKRNVIDNPHTSLETLEHMAKTEPHPRIRKQAANMHHGRKDLDGWIPETPMTTESVKTFFEFKAQVQ